MNTGAGLGDIQFTGTLDGTTSHLENLTLTAGTGAITFAGNVGATPLGIVTVNSAGSTNANGALFSAATLALVAPGNTIINGDLTLTTELSTVAGAYNVSILGATNSVAGATVFNNSGLLNIGIADGSGNSTFIGGVTAISPSNITLNGSIATTSPLADMNFANAGTGILLGSDVVLSATGTVSLNVVNGGVVANNLSIAANDLVLGGPVGPTITNINTLTIQNISTTGTITLSGAGGLAISQAEWNHIGTGVSGVGFVNLGSALNQGAIIVDGAWDNNSAVTVNFLENGLGSFAVNDNITNLLVPGSGNLTVNGSGNTTTLGANITQGFIDIHDSIVVNGGTRVLTATGFDSNGYGINIDTNGFTFTPAKGISANAAGNLTLLTQLLGGSISLAGTFTNPGPGTSLNNLTIGGDGIVAGTMVVQASGLITGDLFIGNGSSIFTNSIDIDSFGGSLTAKSIQLLSNSTVRLTGNTSLISTGGDINFGSITTLATLNSDAIATPRDLALNAGINNVLFSGAVGNTALLGALTITSNNVTLSGVGNNAVGAMTVTNAGIFTTGVGANLVVGGDFSQSGFGSNSIGGDITSTGGITFATDVTLTNTVTNTMTSGGGVGNNITFTGVLHGTTPNGQNLTLAAGTAGNITFIGEVGSVLTPLNAITILSANNVTQGDGIVNRNPLNATTLSLANVLGTATFTGALTLDTLLVPNTVVNFESTGDGTEITNRVQFANRGFLTLGKSGGTQIYNNGFDTTDVNGLVTLNGRFATINAPITLGDFSLGSDTTLNAQSTGLGTISLGGVTGNGFDLTLINASEVIGTPNLADVSVVGVGTLSLNTIIDATFNGSVNVVTSLSLANISGTATFTNAVTAETLSVPISVNNFASTGSGGTITNEVIFLNSGTLELGQTGGVQTYTGGFDTSRVIPGPVILKGEFITGPGGNVTLGNLNLTESMSFDVDGTFSVGRVDGNGFELNIAARDLVLNVLNGTVNNLAVLTIQNYEANGNITLIGTGGLAFETKEEWNLIQSDVLQVVLGNTATNIGDITVAAAWENNLKVDVDFSPGGNGSFHVNGNITGSGSLTVHGSGNTTFINSDINQDAILITGAVVVQGTAVTRTLTANGSGSADTTGVTIDSTGFSNGISANNGWWPR
ncbi:MAG: hypothetical protein NTW56_16190 [Alphaproteobacteria bacterium]|nr:hypothetical protein [Alphaproteobacteria bacterium]